MHQKTQKPHCCNLVLLDTDVKLCENFCALNIIEFFKYKSFILAFSNKDDYYALTNIFKTNKASLKS